MSLTKQDLQKMLDLVNGQLEARQDTIRHQDEILFFFFLILKKLALIMQSGAPRNYTPEQNSFLHIQASKGSV